jgi:hypothetical protein
VKFKNKNGDVVGEIVGIGYDENNNLIIDVIYLDSSKRRLKFVNPYPVAYSSSNSRPYTGPLEFEIN